VNAVPEHLDQQARQKWAAVYSLLEGRGDELDTGTLDALTAYVVAWSQWMAAQEKVAELGPVIKSAAGFAIVSPYVTVAAQAERRMRQWAAELKLTPKTRGKAKAEQPESAVLSILKQMDSQANQAPRKRKATA
jgi:P27 family predicted phage terminase small subunit